MKYNYYSGKSYSPQKFNISIAETKKKRISGQLLSGCRGHCNVQAKSAECLISAGSSADGWQRIWEMFKREPTGLGEQLNLWMIRSPILICDFLPERDFMTESSRETGGSLKKERECAKYIWPCTGRISNSLWKWTSGWNSHFHVIFVFWKRNVNHRTHILIKAPCEWLNSFVLQLWQVLQEMLFYLR